MRWKSASSCNLPLLVPFLPLGSLPTSWLRSPATDSAHPPFTSFWLSLSSPWLHQHPRQVGHSPDPVLREHFAPQGSSTLLHPSTTTPLNGQPSEPDSPVQPLLYLTPSFPPWLANCHLWESSLSLPLTWKWGVTEVQLWFLGPDIATQITRNCAKQVCLIHKYTFS